MKKGEWEKLEPDPAIYKRVTEPHDRGAILVATIFDAFQRIYQHKTQDLIRIASGGTGELPKGSISPDLVKRLTAEACQIAGHLLHICIRALDYCPPIDISFGNYLRALISADCDVSPEDENGYRIALIEAFRAWGIFPDRVNTMSVESLRWSPPSFTQAESDAFHYLTKFLEDDIGAMIEQSDRKNIFSISQNLQAKFHNNLMQEEKQDFTSNAWERFMNKLGLTSRPFKLTFQNQVYPVPSPPLEIHKIRPAFRVGREGRQIQQIIITMSQTVRLKIPSKSISRGTGESKEIIFRGGCTLILALGDQNKVQYAIVKNVKSQRRFDKQMDFQENGEDYSMNLTTYQPPPKGDGADHNISFKHLHFHTI